MKRRRTTTTTPFLTHTYNIALSVCAALVALSIPIMALSSGVSADAFQSRIDALEREISQQQRQADELRSQSRTLENELASLESEKRVLQAEIDKSEAEQERIEAAIKENEVKLEANQAVLGEVIADLYVDSDMTSLELFASSGSVADFIDRQEHRTSLATTLDSTVKAVTQLKEELEADKVALEQVLGDLRGQRTALVAKERERQAVLSETRGEEQRYRQMVERNEKQRDDLMRQQQAAIEAALRAAGGGGAAVPGDPNRGGYPDRLANSNYYNPIVDPWGMYSRQCVSYTAWKVFQKNGHMPYWGGVGNANQWPGNARNAGIPVNKTPRAGSVGVIMAGQYGHVVWVESVNANGTINISQYNEWDPARGWGHYSERYNVSPGAYDWYIHF